MANKEKHKNNELIALRFKEIRLNYFHCKTMKKGKKSDHSQEDFGEFLDVDAATIRNYEKGHTPIPEKHLRKLANEYNIRIEYLLGNDDFHTLREKLNAMQEKEWKKKIATPVEISSLIGDILEKMGYTEFEDDITEKEYLTANFEVPSGYTTDRAIPQKLIFESFYNSAGKLHIYRYCGIKRKKDGKMKYITDTQYDAIFNDIEKYIKYRIEQEF